MFKWLKRLFCLTSDQREMLGKIDAVLFKYTDRYCDYTRTELHRSGLYLSPVYIPTPADKLDLLAATFRPKWELLRISRRGKATRVKFFKDSRRSIAMVDEALGMGEVVQVLSEGRLAVELKWDGKESSVELNFIRTKGGGHTAN